MLGGTIKAQSVVGEGSTFTVTLRLRMCADAAQTAAEAPGPAVYSAERGILLPHERLKYPFQKLLADANARIFNHTMN